MNYKYSLGKKFVDPEDLKPVRNDLATLDPEAIMEIANKLVGQNGFSYQEVDELAKTSRVIRRMQAFID
jgi:hypothetical protein